MGEKIHLKVITHEKIVYENDIDELYVKTTDGSTYHETDHALITWLSCTDHETDHALITSISCTDHMI